MTKKQLNEHSNIYTHLKQLNTSKFKHLTKSVMHVAVNIQTSHKKCHAGCGEYSAVPLHNRT